MKILFIEKQEKEKTHSYPYIGKHKTGAIFYFSSPNTGLCLIRGESLYSSNIVYTNINEHNFCLFKGIVTLENEND